jgi:RHS repeat-associated protein
LLCGERGSRNAVTATYSYDRADRISSAGATSYTVNANGNLTARGSDSFSYDQANRLTGTTVGSVTASYAYDGAGKRATKTVGSTATNYVYDVNRGLPVLLEDGTRRYVWGHSLAYEVESDAALVYHTDGLGSVRAITNSSAAVVQTYATDEFGSPISSGGGSSQPFGFTGERRDSENGLVYLRARYYDPVIGRFTSQDRFRGAATSPASLHRYHYASNSPINLIDPSGFKSVTLRSFRIDSTVRPQSCSEDIPQSELNSGAPDETYDDATPSYDAWCEEDWGAAALDADGGGRRRGSWGSPSRRSDRMHGRDARNRQQEIQTQGALRAGVPRDRLDDFGQFIEDEKLATGKPADYVYSYREIQDLDRKFLRGELSE